MATQAQEELINMLPCWACGEKESAHTITHFEKQCKPKKQLESQTTMWHTKNRKTHIKRKKTKHYSIAPE